MALLDTIDGLPSDTSIGDLGHADLHDGIQVGLKDLKTVFLTLDQSAVKITGNQTLAGIKTFQNSPIVPTPTTDFQASTKKYVDDGLATKTNTGHTHTIANITSLQTTLDSKANLASPTFTGTVSGITKAMVGLGNVDNVSDLLKPISTATQAGLDTKITKTATANSVYGNNGSGATIDISYSSGTTANTIVYRTTGGVFSAGEPTTTTHVATKNYVDTTLANALSTGVVTTTDNQTISGVKLFNSAPRLTPTSTAGYAWIATDTLGNGQWSGIVNAPEGTVPWTNITGRPTTFTPEAHIHAIADVTNLTATLAGKVDTTRTITAGTGLTGGGDLSANRTLSVSYGTAAGTAAQGNDARLSDTRIPTDNTVSTTKYVDGSMTIPKMSTTARPFDVCFTQSVGTRKVGSGEIPLGIRINRSVTFTQVLFRFETADASGSSILEVRKNGVAVYSATMTAPAVAVAATGTVSFADGDILTVYTNTIGTTPGKGLVADIAGYLS